MRSFAPLIVLALAAPCAAQPVHRCVDEHGILYTDRPCDLAWAEAPAADVRSPAPPAPAVAAASPARSPDAGEDVVPGMDVREVLARYGRPRETRVQWRNRTMLETWTWANGGRSFSITFRDGRVAAR